MNNPRVYVGTYGKYNGGSLAGGWIGLNDCKDYKEFLQKCRALHKSERDPEYMIQDAEDFPDGLSCGEWLSEQDFLDVKQAMGEGPIIRIVDYNERSFAVVGDTKPLKNELKKLGGCFNGKLSCGAGWIFAIGKKDAVAAFIASGEVQGSKVQGSKDKPAAKDTALLEEYMQEWDKVWHGDKRMLDYERKRFSYAIRLQNGGILYFEKPSIETKFCFHDEGPDYEFYKHLHAKEERLREYFVNQNLQGFDEDIKLLQEPDHDCRSWYIQRQSYNGETAPLNLWKYTRLSEWNIQNHPSWYGEVALLGDADRKAIVAALKHEREKFKKRLDTYLNRYGVSKLHTWTYWVDA